MRTKIRLPKHDNPKKLLISEHAATEFVQKKLRLKDPNLRAATIYARNLAIHLIEQENLFGVEDCGRAFYEAGSIAREEFGITSEGVLTFWNWHRRKT